MSRLSQSRTRFESEWQRLRRSIRREVGTEPRWSPRLVLPLLALATGVLVGVSVRSRCRGGRGRSRREAVSPGNAGGARLRRG